MDYSLSLYELGKILEKIDMNHNMSLLNRIKLSGGWMTLNGEARVEYIPKSEGIVGGNNIISLKLISPTGEGNSIKITGLKELKFNVNLSQSKYKVINKGGLNLDQVKEKSDKCTLRIDEDMIFTINAPIEEIKKYF